MTLKFCSLDKSALSLIYTSNMSKVHEMRDSLSSSCSIFSYFVAIHPWSVHRSRKSPKNH